MEHCATELGVDPLEFRMQNLLSASDGLCVGGEMSERDAKAIRKVIQLAKTSAKFDIRKTEVDNHNRVSAVAVVRTTVLLQTLDPCIGMEP